MRHREHVVPVLALELRDVHLEPVVEGEERFQPRAVVDQPVERRKERDAVGNGAVVRIGVRAPLALDEPDAERAEALLVEELLRSAQPGPAPSPDTSARRDPRPAGRCACRRSPKLTARRRPD